MNELNLNHLTHLIKSYSVVYNKNLTQEESEIWSKIVIHNLKGYEVNQHDLESILFDFKNINMINPMDFVFRVITGQCFDVAYKGFLEALHESCYRRVIIEDDVFMYEASLMAEFKRKSFFDLSHYGNMKANEVKRAYLSLDRSTRYNNIIPSYYESNSSPISFYIMQEHHNIMPQVA